MGYCSEERLPNGIRLAYVKGWIDGYRGRTDYQTATDRYVEAKGTKDAERLFQRRGGWIDGRNRRGSTPAAVAEWLRDTGWTHFRNRLKDRKGGVNAD